MNANESTMGGQGTITRKAQPVELKAGEPVLRAVVTITRAATGAAETYELIGTVAEEKEL